jgi:hypothetical protein
MRRGRFAVPYEEIDLLRSVLARAYDKRQPFLLRLVQAVKNRFGSDTTRKPVIQSLNIDKKKDAA